MKILVVEDKEMHCDAAKETLEGHDVTIVRSFDDAMKLMNKKIDVDKVQKTLVKAGFSEKPSHTDNAKWKRYWKIRESAEKKSIIPFPFEVVLTDMNMPMSMETLTRDAFNPDEQVSYGFIIALRATLVGARYVAMVTDTNHHLGAMSAALDHLGRAYYFDGFKPNFKINGAIVMFVHSPFIKEVAGKKMHGNCNGRGCEYCQNSGQVDDERHERKNWGQVLKDLLQ